MRLKMMKYPKYFQLSEFIVSDTATKKKIKNCPNWTELEHIIEVALFMDDMRDAYGNPICVSSGFRCDALNKAVGGSKTSVHKIGYAVDFYIKGNVKDMDEFFEWVSDYLTTNNLMFDQLIKEKNGKGGYWIHLGLYNNDGQQRKQIKSMYVK